MKIAVVGAGVSGLTCAYLLAPRHEVHVFEAADHAGGHTHTHDIELDGGRWCVDSGFIVFNPVNYPLFCRLLDELGVAAEDSEMSFSVKNDTSGLEYNATTLNRLFCQRRNLLRPRFLRMIRDILRFYREAPGLLRIDAPGPTAGEYLRDNDYSQAFIDDHLVPMASALWSMPPGQVLGFPIRYMIQFMANHRMLQVSGRPRWRVISGGSRNYIEPLVGRFRDTLHLSSEVRSVARTGNGLTLQTDAGEAKFDRVILACHSDQALSLLARPSAAERETLGAMGYQQNEAVLHTDTSLLPRNRAAWAGWNARVTTDPDRPGTVTYDMNILQNLDAPVELLVTLNQTADIDPETVLRRMVYHHPVYTRASVAAQRRFDQIDGVDGIHYCGAYWGWGFHEDGVRSAVRVCRKLGMDWDA